MMRSDICVVFKGLKKKAFKIVSGVVFITNCSKECVGGAVGKTPNWDIDKASGMDHSELHGLTCYPQLGKKGQ